MKNAIDISTNHLSIVQEILQRHLPQQATVWVFGSRAKGTAKKYSDLDLLIDLGKPISIKLMADLASDFEECDLPYKVDIVDWAAISESFRERINSERIALPKQ